MGTKDADVRERPTSWFDVTNARSEPIAAAAVVWIAWLAVSLVVVRNHEPWRDELQAWGLARSAANPFELLGFVRGEGHPPGWHMFLWLPAKVAPDAMTLQWAALLLAAGATWLILRHLPLPLGVRALVVFGYFPLYELSVVARNYVLAYSLVVVVLWLAHRQRTHPAVLAALLLAVVGASITALPLAVGLALGLWGGRMWASAHRLPARWVWVAVVVVPLIVAAVVFRPSRGGNSTIAFGSVGLSTLWSNMAAPLRALAPFSALSSSFWGVPTVGNWGWWGPVLGLAIVVAVTVAVRHSLSAVTIWLVSTLGFVLLVTVTQQILAPRIVSAVWLGALATVWVASADRLAIPTRKRRPIPWPVAAGASLALAAGLWAGMWASWSDITTPFSSGEGAVRWIQEQATGDITILCAANRPLCSSVVIRLDTPGYMASGDDGFTFVQWNLGWARTLPLRSVAANAQALAERTGGQVFVVAPEMGFPEGCERGWQPEATITSERLRVCRADQLITTTR